MTINFSDAISTIAQQHQGIDEIEKSLVMFKSKNSIKVIVPFCEVELYDQQKREYIKSTWSDEDGAYSFPNLNRKDFKYFIIAHHPSAEFNGVIADNIGRDDVDS